MLFLFSLGGSMSRVIAILWSYGGCLVRLVSPHRFGGNEGWMLGAADTLLGDRRK